MPTISMADVRANPLYSYLIDDLDFSKSIWHACHAVVSDDRFLFGDKSSFKSPFLIEILQKTEDDLSRAGRVGRKNMEQLNAFLNHYGFSLNTYIQDRPGSPEDFYNELEAIRGQRKSKLPKLQQMAASDNYMLPKEWLKAARELLSPNNIARIEDERERTVLASRLQQQPTPYKELAQLYHVSESRIRNIEEEAIRSLRRTIRQDLIPPGAKALSPKRPKTELSKTGRVWFMDGLKK